jgi:cytidylate kinase
VIEPVVVAIDGPSGSGKSSVSKGVARNFGLSYLDTGAMYRAMTWSMLDQRIDLGDPAAIAVASVSPEIVSGIDPADPAIHVGTIDVGEAIRAPEVTQAVSAVSAVPAVRERLVELQRSEVAAAVRHGSGIVVEGRDIGTTVLPNADVKVYLTADPSVRAQRRSAEDAGLTHGSAGTSATEDSLRRRDQMDSERSASPLRAAEDAHVVDATHLDLAQTIEVVASLVTAAADRNGNG